MKRVKLGDITESCLGKMLDAEKNKGEYEPYLANINVRWGEFDLDNLSQMRFEKKEQERYGIKYGDLIMCEGGEPGRCAIWRDDIPNMKIQKALHRIRVKDCVNVEWLYYWFLLAGKKNLLKGYFTETTIKHLTGDMLREIELDLPELSVQEKIAKVLAPIDEKIRLNNKINNNLYQQAMTVYMHKFFRKASNGQLKDVIFEQPKSSIQVGDAKTLVGEYPFFTSGKEILEHPTYLVDGRNILLNTGGNADVKLYIGKASYSTDTWCIQGIDNLTDYLFLFLSSINVELDKKYFQGSTLKHLQKDLLKLRSLYAPNYEEIREFNSIIQPLLTKISTNTIENNKLVRLRTWLLPMLMNGQATIVD